MAVEHCGVEPRLSEWLFWQGPDSADPNTRVFVAAANDRYCILILHGRGIVICRIPQVDKVRTTIASLITIIFTCDITVLVS